MALTMQLFTKRESKPSHGLFKFAPRMLRLEDLEGIRRNGFVLIAGTSQIARIRRLLKELPVEETLLIYSSWEGYYTIPEQIAANPRYKKIRELFCNIIDIHTSGHADRATIRKVVNIVNARQTIFIHKEKDVVL